MDRTHRKSVMTSFDIRAVVNELSPRITGKFIENIYQVNAKTFLIRLTPGDLRLIIELERRIHLTKYRVEVPPQHPQFCKELRKHLLRGKLESICQYKFERVVVIEVSKKEENFQLVAEIFRRGNLILVDSKLHIVTALYFAEMKDRRILRGEPFVQAPTTGLEPQRVEITDIQKFASEGESISRALRNLLPFPPSYINEILCRANLNAEAKSNEVPPPRLKELTQIIRQLYDEHRPAALQPRIILDQNNETSDVTPTALKIHESFPARSLQTFNDALDEYFSQLALEQAREKALAPSQSEIEELQRIITSLSDRKKIIEEQIQWNTAIGNLILENASTLQDLIANFRDRFSKGIKEGDIKWVLDLDGKNKRIKIRLRGEEFWVTFTESPFKNAGIYFDRVKELRNKLAGIESTLAKYTRKLQSSESKVSQDVHRVELVVKRKKEWYEKFRWFRSSDSILVLVGRDARTNELLIERYTSPNDAIFHADVHGAPFAVVKSEGKPVSEIALHEAAIAAASYSRAWSGGYSSADAYWVKPEQLSKKAPSGEYISKGMFMIYGPRNYYKGIELRLAIGVLFTNDSPEVIGGPVEAVKSRTPLYVEIIPSKKGQKRLTHEILHRLRQKASKGDKDKLKKIEINEIQTFIPAGKGELA